MSLESDSTKFLYRHVKPVKKFISTIISIYLQCFSFIHTYIYIYIYIYTCIYHKYILKFYQQKKHIDQI